MLTALSLKELKTEQSAGVMWRRFREESRRNPGSVQTSREVASSVFLHSEEKIE